MSDTIVNMEQSIHPLSQADMDENFIELANGLNQLASMVAVDFAVVANVSSSANAQEQAARIASDAILTSDLATEISTRASADSTIAGNLATEMTNRAAADNLKVAKAGDTMTGQLVVPAGATGGIAFPTNAFGGSGDTASITLVNPSGGEITELTIAVSNDATDIVNISATDGAGTMFNNNLQVNHNVVLNAANFNTWAATKAQGLLAATALQSTDLTGYATQTWVTGQLGSTTGIPLSLYYGTAGTYLFTVPAGVVNLMFSAVGAGGATGTFDGGSHNHYGLPGSPGGGLIQTIYSVTSGEVLTLIVGKGGGASPSEWGTGATGTPTLVKRSNGTTLFTCNQGGDAHIIGGGWGSTVGASGTVAVSTTPLVAGIIDIGVQGGNGYWGSTLSGKGSGTHGTTAGAHIFGLAGLAEEDGLIQLTY